MKGKKFIVIMAIFIILCSIQSTTAFEDNNLTQADIQLDDINAGGISGIAVDDSSSNAQHEYRQVDVLQIITNVIDDTDLQLQEKGIELKLQLPQNIEVQGDSSLLYSIFRNLIDNTISYAYGATRLVIACREIETEGRHFYEFNVSDNGQGVDPQHREHLFERFYRVDKGRSRKLGGTGLGLAIVKNAVMAHGGQTEALATPGGGLTIRFTLARF